MMVGQIFTKIGTFIENRQIFMLLNCNCAKLANFEQETQLSLRDRATRACQLKSGKVLHKCRRLVFEKV